MTKDVHKDIYRDFLSGTFVVTLFLLSYAFIPFLGIFISILTPLPILFYYKKLGRVSCVLISLIASMIAAYFLKHLRLQLGVFFIVEFGLIGLTFSEMLWRNLSVEKTVLYSTCIILGGGTLFAFFYGVINVMNPWTLLVQQINEKVNQTILLYQELGMSVEQIDSLKASAQSLAHFFVRTFPSFMAVGTVLILWINLLIARRIFERRKFAFPDFGDLSRWKAPDILVWGVILGGILLLARGYVLKSIGLNLLIISLGIFFFQGIAIVSYFFQKKNIPVILRGIGYVLICIQQVFLLIVVALGFFDVWADFRRLEKSKI